MGEEKVNILQCYLSHLMHIVYTHLPTLYILRLYHKQQPKPLTEKSRTQTLKLMLSHAKFLHKVHTFLFIYSSACNVESNIAFKEQLTD